MLETFGIQFPRKKDKRRQLWPCKYRISSFLHVNIIFLRSCPVWQYGRACRDKCDSPTPDVPESKSPITHRMPYSTIQLTALIEERASRVRPWCFNQPCGWLLDCSLALAWSIRRYINPNNFHQFQIYDRHIRMNLKSSRGASKTLDYALCCYNPSYTRMSR